MTRNEMWNCYRAIMMALENHNIDTTHDSLYHKTTFYFRDCCGGTIIDEALKYLTNNKK